jgi:hypothetical protein
MVYINKIYKNKKYALVSKRAKKPFCKIHSPILILDIFENRKMSKMGKRLLKSGKKRVLDHAAA